MRVAILGCAHIHMKDAIEAIERSPETNIVAVWDHQRERAAYWANKLGILPMSELRVGDVDAIIVMSETSLHSQLAKIATDARKPLFVEKPMATSYEEAQRIVKMVAQSGALFHTGYFLREIGAMQQLRALVQRNAFGKVVRARALFAHEGVPAGWFDDYPWMLRKEDVGYGGFGDLGVHLVDLLIWILGSPVSAVSACLRTITPGLEVDDCGEALLRLQDDTTVTIGAGLAERDAPFELLITGTDGYAVIRDSVLTIETVSHSSKHTVEAPCATKGIQHFLAALRGESEETLVSVEEAAGHCAVLDACYRSASQRSWIEISP